MPKRDAGLDWGGVIGVVIVVAAVVGGTVYFRQQSAVERAQNETKELMVELMAHDAAHDGEGHDAMMGDEMVHEMVSVPAGEPAPRVELVVTADAKSGWNLQLITENFEFSPERASGEHVLGEGHAHLYVDGKKISRIYGQWVHVDKLAPGSHTLRVTLNANNHNDYMVNGELVADEFVVDVPE